jgi:glycosyltransferase involved in cell wall biosynthesis
MPAFNAEDYILNAVNSVLNQSYNNIELIVVNDGSTDRTEEILRGIHNPKLKLVTTINKGQCAAANLAFHHSKGEFVKFMDADDIISADFIENQVKVLKGDLNKIASAKWGRFYNNDLSTFQLNPETVWRDMKPIDWLVESLLSGHNMMQCGLWLIPRAIVVKSGLWNEDLSLINDFDFIIRLLLQSHEIKFAPGSILYYRSGISGSLSNQTSRQAYQSACMSTQLGCSRILNFENSYRTRKVCANSYKLWEFACYPNYPDLSLQMANECKKMGGSNMQYPAGGITKMLIQIFGWKLTKILKLKYLNF